MKKTSFFKIILTLILCVFVFSFTACGSTKVNVEEHIAVTFSGYDGYAKAELSVDTTAIDAYVEDNAKLVKKLEELNPENEIWTGMVSNATLTDLFTISFDENYQNLSNGDIVRVEIKMNDFFSAVTDFATLQETVGVEFSPVVFEYTVSGLEEAKVFDVIGLVKDYISITGGNGGAKATISIPEDFYAEVEGFILDGDRFGASLYVIKDNQSYGGFNFKLVKDEEFAYDASALSNGDEINLNVSGTAIHKLLQEGYIVPDTLSITISDLGEYISSPDQLTDEIKTEINAWIDDYVKSKEGTFNSYPNFKITNYYWATLNPTAIATNIASEKNQLCIMFEYENMIAKQYGLFTPEIVLNNDGTYIITMDDYVHTGFVVDYLLSESYTYEPIEF